MSQPPDPKTGLFLPRSIGWPALGLLVGWLVMGVVLWVQTDNRITNLEDQMTTNTGMLDAMNRLDSRLSRIEGTMEILLDDRRPAPRYVPGPGNPQ